MPRSSLIIPGIIVTAALALGGAMALYPSMTHSSSAVRIVSPTEFTSAAHQPGVQLIDLRTPQEYASGHLAGASEIDFYAPDFQQQIASLDRHATYAIYCHTGNRSGQTATLMARMGFTHVIDLAGGIAAWEAVGLPITTQ